MTRTSDPCATLISLRIRVQTIPSGREGTVASNPLTAWQLAFLFFLSQLGSPPQTLKEADGPSRSQTQCLEHSLPLRVPGGKRRPPEPAQDVRWLSSQRPQGPRAQEVRRGRRQILCAGEKVGLFLAPAAAQGGSACGRETGWERWRLKQTRCRVTQPFKVGWLHPAGKK